MKNDKSKNECIKITMQKNVMDFLDIISDNDPKSDFNKTRLCNDLMRYGIVWAFSNGLIRTNLDNREQGLRDLRRNVSNFDFERSLYNFVNENKKLK